MTIILSSILSTHYYDENGVKCPQVLPDDNGILTEIKNRAGKCNRVVYVANDPSDTEHNDVSAPPVFEGLHLSGLDFKEKILLDIRNAPYAEKILLGADLIILSGGKVLCQRDFFNRIKLGEILNRYNGLVIGVSAGAMNLCKDIFNFPEEERDIGAPLFTDGLGFYDKIIVPHFDGETKSYQLPCDEIDIVNDYVLPMSEGRTFIGLPNLSYILIDGKKVEMRGIIYSISDGTVKRIH